MNLLIHLVKSKMRIFFYLFLFIGACTTSTKKLPYQVYLKKVDFDDIKTFKTANIQGIRQSFLNSCDVFFTSTQEPKTQAISLGTRANMLKHCNKIQKTKDDQDFMSYITDNFNPYLVTNGGGSKGKFTAYYSAVLNISDTQTEKYKFPIYKRPADLDTKTPYHTAKEIDNGALKGLELFWTDSYYSVFMLHVQGHGTGYLPDGKSVNIAFDGSTSYPFVSCWKKYKENLQPTTGQSFEEWVKSDDIRAQKYCNEHRKSYVFFRSSDSPSRGSSGAIVTNNRSLAVDDRYIPQGSLMWVEVDDGTFNGPVMAQDKGAAIKGPIRGDIYLGTIPNAEKMALKVNNQGSYFIFIPKNA